MFSWLAAAQPGAFWRLVSAKTRAAGGVAGGRTGPAGLADLPAELADASGPTVAHDWGYAAEPDASGRSILLPRARFIGGCSPTNACVALPARACRSCS